MTTSLVSAPWATEADVDALAPGQPAPAGGWEPWLAQASDLLYQLSGRQYRGQAQSRVQIVPTGVDETLRLPVPGWVPVPFDLTVAGDGARAWWGRQIVVVALPSSPVVSVDEVRTGAPTGPDSVLVDLSAYRLRDRAGHLEHLDGGWPIDGGLYITFTHGIAPPAGGVAACVTLAVELANAGIAGVGTSRLANFQTSVTREGVTLGAVNLRDALTGGMTGLPEVDLFLTAVNPKRLARRGSAWTPDHATPIRTHA